SSRRRHTRFSRDWSSDVCSSDLYPPTKSISYNAQLNQSDGLLINYISKTENVSFEEAKQKINLFVEDLKKSLSENQEVSLDGIRSEERRVGKGRRWRGKENDCK